MAIKKLQNNYTTPEQSKRLLELGVPADSADLLYYDHGVGFTCLPIFVEDVGYVCFFNERFLPCWSVGRLIEIRDICANYYITHNDFKGNYIEDIIMSFYAIYATNGFDFSKLEE